MGDQARVRDPGQLNRSLAQVRAEQLARPDLVGVAVCRALSDGYDGWLQAHLPDVAGVALVAVGGLGRREQAPFSDLDLMLLYRCSTAQVRSIAQSLWYPIWDSGIRLDHSVRTADEAVNVARADLKAMLGLLDLRHVAGDAALTGELRERSLELWRREAPKRVEEMAVLTRARWAAHGEAAFLLEPDLKDSRGGLRDWHALRSLAAAQLIDLPRAAVDAASALLDARVELHRVIGRAEDVLRGQEQAAVAAALGKVDDDALLRSVNEAGRALAHLSDDAWRRVDVPTRKPRRFRRGAVGPDRQPLARGVVSQGGEVVLALAADPWADPVLVLRAARAAAEHGLPLAPFAIERLVTECAPLPEPWPAEARNELVALLGTGERAVPVFEALDLAGLMVRLMPEWETVRIKAQRNPVHLFTVDRHLLECAAQAAELARSVNRPDLLLVGAFLHDIGKGYVGDHSVVGAEVAEVITTRMGFSPADVHSIVALVRHHLLLPDTATRRDPDDPKTLAIVTTSLNGSADLLDELHALTIADAAATGPGAWSPWKAGLITDLVDRVHAVLAGSPAEPGEVLDAPRRTMAEQGRLAVEWDGERVLVAVPDGPGVLSKTAGVLALHSLDVLSAAIATHAGMAVNTFTVAPRFGTKPDASLLRQDLGRVIDGSLSLADRLTAKERSYQRAHAPTPPPRVLWFDDEATDATVVELRAADSFGLLHRVTAALERSALDVRSARLSTLGSSVVDAFYVTGPDGGTVPVGSRPEVAQLLLSAAAHAVAGAVA